MAQDPADASATPALLFWSRLIQGAAAVIIVLSLTLLLAPGLGEAIFNLVYFRQPSIPVEVPSLALGYIWFANGIIGAVMAGWMICIILLARGPFLEGRLHAWNTIAIPLASWFFIDTAFSIAHGVWGNVLLNAATGLMFGIPLLFSRRYFRAGH
ncbi:MAG: hypothetical protein FGM55_09810 [Rhodoferax sp.]|nr:hypothetical protein [Rhodoferax sp.]